MASIATPTTTVYPQCWVQMFIRVDDFKARRRFAPDTTVVPGADPIAQASYLGIEKIILPISCQVNLRSYREGDEAKIEIPLSSLPIDPRIIRQGAVKIYMGVLDPSVYSETQGPIGGGAKMQLIPEYGPDIGADGRQRSNEVFRGFFDNVEASYDGEDTLSISCRDITALFIDEEVPIQALKNIPGDVPLDQVIQMIISGDPSARTTPPDDRAARSGKVEARRDARKISHQITVLSNRLAKATIGGGIAVNAAEIQRLNGKILALSNQLIQAQATAVVADSSVDLAPRYGMQSARDVKVVNNTGAPLPTLGSLKGASWFDSKSGAVRVSKRGNSNEKISYWDLITDICVGSGYICYVRTNAGLAEIENPRAEIVIDHPRTYYVESNTELRKFVYGFNVDTISLSRNYGGRGRPASIVVSAVDDVTGGPISARYPPLPLNSKGGLDKDASKDHDDAETFLLRDRIPAKDATGQFSQNQILTDIAHSLFEQRGRAEMEVTIETTIQSALPSNRSVTRADLLELRAADTIEVELLPPETVDTNQPFITPSGAFASLSRADKITRLTKVHKFSDRLAAEVSDAYDSPFLQKFFRVKDMTVDFNAEEGFTFTVKAQNYLDARFAQSVIGTDTPAPEPPPET